MTNECVKTEDMSRDQLVLTIKEKDDKILSLNKDVEKYNTLYSSSSSHAATLKSELEQMHVFLDLLPNSVKRTSEHENSWERVQLSTLTRLSLWLATRGK